MERFIAKTALLVLLLAARASASPATAILLGGGPDRSDAELAMRNWKEFEEVTQELLVLPPGYPKIVDSATIKGMAPGLAVVVAGFCAGEQATRVARFLRALEPGAYTRAAVVPALACPEIASEWQIGASVKVAAGPKNVLRVQIFDDGRKEADKESLAFAVAWLRSATEVLEAWRVGDLRCVGHTVVRLDKTRIRVLAECVTDSCTQDEVRKMSWTLEAEDAIAVAPRVGKIIKEMECD